MQNKEMIVHPNHYQLNINIEVMDVIEIVINDLQKRRAFDIGNVIKYLLRAEKKNGLEDYKKALYYLSEYTDSPRTNYNNTALTVLDSVLATIKDEKIRKCLERVFEYKFGLAKIILEKYIKEKENEQTTETEE